MERLRFGFRSVRCNDDATRVTRRRSSRRIPGANPFHYVVVHVDGDRFNIEVVGVDWGKGFAPYRSSTASLSDPKPDNP
jgi:hypothetical protein